MNQTKPEGSRASTMEDLQERIAGMDVKEDDGPTFGSTVRVQKDDGTTFAQDDGPTFGGGFTIATHLSCLKSSVAADAAYGPGFKDLTKEQKYHVCNTPYIAAVTGEEPADIIDKLRSVYQKDRDDKVVAPVADTKDEAPGLDTLIVLAAAAAGDAAAALTLLVLLLLVLLLALLLSRSRRRGRRNFPLTLTRTQQRLKKRRTMTWAMWSRRHLRLRRRSKVCARRPNHLLLQNSRIRITKLCRNARH